MYWRKCSFCCLALDMPQLGKFNLLEGCCVTAEWDRQLSYYWSFCHSGFVFWHSQCEVFLPKSGPRSIFQGKWRCVEDLLAPCKVWPFVLEMFTLLVSHTATGPASFLYKCTKWLLRLCLLGNVWNLASRHLFSSPVFLLLTCAMGLSAAVPSKIPGRASAPVEVRGKAPADSRVSGGQH